jgi:uncharacterized protein (TIGR03437 family)
MSQHCRSTFFQLAFRCGLAAAACAAAMPLFAAGGNDQNASSWQYIVLTGPTQIAVAAPAPVTDPGFLQELAVIKNSQAVLTGAEKTALQNWSGSGMVRWNQILLGLVASADLPPEPNSDGTYPAPSAATPFAFPQYPFANPPYAARSYSYVAEAQYEALKVAWYYKYLYNRPSPSDVAGSGVSALIGTNLLPGYPSADAVESGVAVTLLSSLFPTQIDLINATAAEQQLAAQISGKAAASDIAAGYALGEAVAAVFLSRAGSDGLKNATGTTAQWQAIASAVTASGQIAWVSQENPPRPPMLPFFGQVKAWLMSPADIVNNRPGPPPSTSSQAFAQQVASVKQTLQNLTRDQQAIATKWADGASSPTPPGHWNFIAEPYIQNAGWSEVRSARAFALLDMALHDAAVACWDTKYTYYNPRPAQIDPTIKTVIGLPNFPSYESGHSTFSGAASAVLDYLFPAGKSVFDAEAQEAAVSRLYGGIHYPIDNSTGLTHGTVVGGFALRFAQQDGADAPTASASTSAQALDGASFHYPIAAGSLASIFQANLAPGLAVASGVPVSTSLSGVSASFAGGLATPVLSVAPNQANIQIPWDLQGLSSAVLNVTGGDGSQTSFSVPLATYAPAIFTVNAQGTGQGMVTVAGTGALAAAAGSVGGAMTQAATAGQFISIECLGLGPVNNTPANGAQTPDGTSTTLAPVSVLLNGVSVPASFAGLAPGLVGVYQVNVQIPDGAPTGTAVPISISVGGVVSNTVTIAIQ